MSAEDMTDLKKSFLKTTSSFVFQNMKKLMLQKLLSMGWAAMDKKKVG